MCPDGPQMACEIVAEADRILRETPAETRTPEESQTVKAAEFLRKVAPYLFDSE